MAQCPPMNTWRSLKKCLLKSVLWSEYILCNLSFFHSCFCSHGQHSLSTAPCQSLVWALGIEGCEQGRSCPCPANSLWDREIPGGVQCCVIPTPRTEGHTGALGSQNPHIIPPQLFLGGKTGGLCPAWTPPAHPEISLCFSSWVQDGQWMRKLWETHRKNPVQARSCCNPTA